MTTTKPAAMSADEAIERALSCIAVELSEMDSDEDQSLLRAAAAKLASMKTPSAPAPLTPVKAANYTVTFERSVTSLDQVVRTINALDAAAARVKAESMADLFDHECPDDTKEFAGNCGGWYVESLKPVGVDAVADLMLISRTPAKIS
jgi:hypothetical protein